VFHDKVGAGIKRSHDDVVAGLARIAAGVMFVYLFLEALKVLHGEKWQYFHGGWGAWYALEVVGLVALPMVLLIGGSRRRDTVMIRTGGALALLGVVLNRLNLSVIAFKWYAPVHYVPTWMEIVVTLAVISAELWVFRWVIYRMPVLGEKPDWVERAEAAGATPAAPAAPGVPAGSRS
jgi:Ni/Fe-hydrogenase subunit HybB-like protein